MNQIKKLFEDLDIPKTFNYISNIKKNNISDLECHQFKIVEKTDLGESIYYLSVDKDFKYCYFYFLCGKQMNTEILFNDGGEIIFYNSHSNMCNHINMRVIFVEDGIEKKKIIKRDLNSEKEQILKYFTPCKEKYKKSEVKYSIQKICYHFEKMAEKYPIKLEFCHTVLKKDWEFIKKIEEKTRASFNKRKQSCNGIRNNKLCDYNGKLVESHLVSGNNIRNLNNKDTTTYYGSRFFSELNDRPFSFLQTISDEKRNSKNRNFKIACFCNTCENLFIKSDKNSFIDIKEITNEVINKTFGVYLQEFQCAIETYENLKNETAEIKIFADKYFNISNMRSCKEELLKKIKLYKDNELIKYEHSSSLELKDKPFMESICLNIYKGYFYLIHITNKNNKMLFNFITDNPSFKNESPCQEHLIYSAITLNTYNMYSDSFYTEIKYLGTNILYDYFNNDINKFCSNPILIPKINYLNDIRDIVKKYKI